MAAQNAKISRLRIEAFTLVELLVVISVLGILATIAVQTTRDSLTRARIAIFVSRAKVLAVAHQEFVLQTGQQPEEVQNCRNTLGRNTELATNRAHDFFACSLSQMTDQENFMDPFVDRDYGWQQMIAAGKRKINDCVLHLKKWDDGGSVIASRGPDNSIEKFEGSVVNKGIQYDITNGIRSNGDIFLTLPEATPPTFLSLAPPPCR